jgi:6-pyruvoyltetrahydropterin/6-carboxytetrahydropterin synthase
MVTNNGSKNNKLIFLERENVYIITKDFHFSASHELKKLPENHQCYRLHGHNYILKVELQSKDLDTYDFVLDYGALSKIKIYIDENFDHRHLNDVMENNNPTAELIAKHFYDLFKPDFLQISAIHISETPKTWAVYRE